MSEQDLYSEPVEDPLEDPEEAVSALETIEDDEDDIDVEVAEADLLDQYRELHDDEDVEDEYR